MGKPNADRGEQGEIDGDAAIPAAEEERFFHGGEVACS